MANMNHGSHTIFIKKLSQHDIVPYNLLLLADPSKEMVDKYLEQSEVFAAVKDGKVAGVIVLYPLTHEAVEIKNIAVRPEFQGQGIGSYLIKDAVRRAAAKKLKTVFIATADSSIRQLDLYQKLGFEITEIKRGFFIQHYPEPIYENGIQARHLIVLAHHLIH